MRLSSSCAERGGWQPVGCDWLEIGRCTPDWSHAVLEKGKGTLDLLTYLVWSRGTFFLGASPGTCQKREKRGHVGRILAAGGAEVFMRATGKGVDMTISGCVAGWVSRFWAKFFRETAGRCGWCWGFWACDWSAAVVGVLESCWRVAGELLLGESQRHTRRPTCKAEEANRRAVVLFSCKTLDWAIAREAHTFRGVKLQVCL